MQYRSLGSSNLKVSTLCLGTMMFGDQTDQAEAARITADAHANGVNYIDTADVYTNGASEIIVGELLKNQRHDWVLATKMGNVMSPKVDVMSPKVDVMSPKVDATSPHGKATPARVNEGHYSRSWMLREIDASLKRLQTDYVDVLYLHRDYNGMNLEEPLRALDAMLRAGKIRYWGVSNFRGWRIAELVRLAGQLGMPGPVVCQPYYNLLNRMPEVEILPACKHFGIGVTPYSPIARGVLTGKYLPGQTPDASSRAGRGDKRIMDTEFRAESLAIAQTLKAHVQQRGMNLAQFACAWVLASGSVTSVIAGPRTLAQWVDYLPAVDTVITPEDEALVDSLVRPGHPSTPGFTDPAYPLLPR